MRRVHLLLAAGALGIAVPAAAVDYFALSGAYATNFGTDLTIAFAYSPTSSYGVTLDTGGSGFAGPTNAQETGVTAYATQAGPSRFTGQTIVSTVSASADLPTLTALTSIVGEEEMGGQAQAGLMDTLRFTNTGATGRLRVIFDIDGPSPGSLGDRSNLFRAQGGAGVDFSYDWLTGTGGTAAPVLTVFGSSEARFFSATTAGDGDYRISYEYRLPTGFTELQFGLSSFIVCQGNTSENCDVALNSRVSFDISGAGITGSSASGAVQYGSFAAAPEPVVPPAAVPEPAAWALLIAGFGAVGGAMRRRRGVAGSARA